MLQRLAETACGSHLGFHNHGADAGAVSPFDSDLPRFCSDVPLTWQRPGVVSLGTDPEVVVEGICSADLRWLTELRGTRTGADLRADLALPSRRRLFDAAVATGAVENWSDASDAWRMLPTEYRATLDGELAAYRHMYKSGGRAHRAMAERLTCRVGIVGEGPIFDELMTTAQQHGITPVERQPDVVMLAPLRHPDALPADSFLEQGAMRGPHLLVRAFGHRGVIGPFVVPGRSACATCWHLHQRDRDQTWSLRAAQLTGFRPAVWPLDRMLAQALAAHAFLLVHTQIANPHAQHLWANQIRTIWLPNGSIDVESVRAHPACGCTDAPLSAMGPGT